MGFVKPSRGARREYRFSFQDLIVLRARARSSMRRCRVGASVDALDDLRKHLPDEAPLSGLSISAVGEQVVVREGHNHFQVQDGQYLLGLDVEVDHGELRVVEHKPRVLQALTPSDVAGRVTENWFACGRRRWTRTRPHRPPASAES